MLKIATAARPSVKIRSKIKPLPKPQTDFRPPVRPCSCPSSSRWGVGIKIGVEEVDPSEAVCHGKVARAKPPNRATATPPRWKVEAVQCAVQPVHLRSPHSAGRDRTLLLKSSGARGEIQLTNARRTVHPTAEFAGVICDGKFFNGGSEIGFLTANVVFAIHHPNVAPQFVSMPKLLGLNCPHNDAVVRRHCEHISQSVISTSPRLRLRGCRRAGARTDRFRRRPRLSPRRFRSSSTRRPRTVPAPSLRSG